MLLGGLGLVAGSAYLMSALDVPSSQLGQAGLSDVQAPPRSVQGAQRWAPSGRRGGQRMQAPAPVGGGVPSWAGSGDGAAPSGGTAIADAGTPGDAPRAGSAPPTPDLGAEWLAAAGAAYALNRLRERKSTDDESGEESPGTS